MKAITLLSYCKDFWYFCQCSKLCWSKSFLTIQNSRQWSLNYPHFWESLSIHLSSSEYYDSWFDRCCGVRLYAVLFHSWLLRFPKQERVHLRQRFFGQALRRVLTITVIFFILSAKNRRVLLIFKVQVWLIFILRSENKNYMSKGILLSFDVGF